MSYRIRFLLSRLLSEFDDAAFIHLFPVFAVIFFQRNIILTPPGIVNRKSGKTVTKYYPPEDNSIGRINLLSVFGYRVHESFEVFKREAIVGFNVEP